ncbi:MAG: AMP-binding protein [Clostridia bacterium]|nr:AMP-binding protein [Clostridia bacterium]
MKDQKIHETLEFANMRELIEWAGETHGNKVAYSYRQKPSDKDIVKVTFNQFRKDVRGLATQLISMGCSGKKCVVIGKFSYDFALMYFATMSIGAVLVPLDRDWQTEELTKTAEVAEAAFLFCDEDIREKAEAIEKALPLSAPLVYMQAKENERNISILSAKGQMLFAKDSSPYFDTLIDNETMSLLVFTSGTTGKGKGVMLSQKNILSNICSAIPYIDYSDKTIGVLPPHHTYGSSIMFAGHAIIGAEIYVSSGLRYITKELKEQAPGHLVLVPLYLETFYRRIQATVKEQGKDKILSRMIKFSNALRKTGVDKRRQFFSSVRAAFGGEVKTIISGGAPINPEILTFFDSIGISTLNGYGITECAPLISFTRSKNNVHGSVGNVIDVDTVKINNPNEDGEGEILVKGPNVMLGYYNDEEATNEAIDSLGYFKTGDYGRLDDNGILHITGRKKNLIILSNGKNVYPEEIENELIAVPGILEIIVYEGQSKRGLAHNAIVAEIYPDREFFKKNGIEDIKSYLKGFVDEYNKTAVPYKKITVIKVREDEFPKNTLRKIMRFKIDTTIE